MTATHETLARPASPGNAAAASVPRPTDSLSQASP
jgi:hypothetical protein